MYENIKNYSHRIIELVKGIKNYKTYKNKFNAYISEINQKHSKKEITEEQYKNLLNQFLKNKSKKEWLDYYNFHILQLLKEINDYNSKIFNSFYKDKTIPKSQIPEPKKTIDITKKAKLAYMKDIKVNPKEIKDFISLQKLQKHKTLKEVKYRIHKPNFYVRFANNFTNKLGRKLIKRFPNIFRPLNKSLNQTGIKILSRAYVGAMLFSSFLSFFIIFLISVYFLRLNPLIITLTRSFVFSLVALIATLLIFYYYPLTIVSSKKRDIKNKLPFAIIHMSAIVGSGSPPITMFKLILESKEYGELSTEIRKIMNYTNLFGYNLSTALRNVAKTTPSPEFKELLNGIVATVESGGDLKAYLKEKADDAMTAYKTERKKYTEVISTLSDVYVGILIAAPVLFIIPLTIINSMGSLIFGLSASTLALIGTYGLIPFLNIVFMLFISITQPEI